MTAARCPIGRIADIEVNKKTGKITVKHVYAAADSGLAVYPGGIENQIVGGVTADRQPPAHRAVPLQRTNVTSGDFVSYPILRFKDAPKVTPIVVQWTEGDLRGRCRRAGVMAPPAAVANAFFDATGVRMRTAPSRQPVCGRR